MIVIAKMRRHLPIRLCFVGLLISICWLIACTGTATQKLEDTPMNSAQNFNLYIFKLADSRSLVGLNDIGTNLPIDYKERALFTASQHDFVSYQWVEQVLILAPQATLSLTGKVQDERIARNPALSVISPEIALDQHVFAATLDEQIIYTGTIVSVGSPRLLPAPVMYVRQVNDQIELTLRPRHPYWDKVLEGAEWAKLRDARVKNIFEQAGILNK